MKKLIAIVLFIAVLALLVSCKPIIKPVVETEEEAESVEIEESIAEIEDLEIDIGLEELESLEQDLENLI